MTRLIDADALLEKIGNAWEYANPMTIIDLIINAPTVEPQKQWVGLSDLEISKIIGAEWWKEKHKFAKAIEAKLKELNHAI